MKTGNDLLQPDSDADNTAPIWAGGGLSQPLLMPDNGIAYHGGPVLTGPLNLYLIWCAVLPCLPLLGRMSCLTVCVRTCMLATRHLERKMLLAVGRKQARKDYNQYKPQTLKVERRLEGWFV